MLYQLKANRLIQKSKTESSSRCPLKLSHQLGRVALTVARPKLGTDANIAKKVLTTYHISGIQNSLLVLGLDLR